MAQWTLEQLKNLRELEAPITVDAVIKVIPISRGSYDKGYGSTIIWDARLFRKGVMGPRQVTELELQGAGLSEAEASDWAQKTKRAVSTLNRLYPVLVPQIEAKVRELEAAMPPALPQGEAKEGA